MKASPLKTAKPLRFLAAILSLLRLSLQAMAAPPDCRIAVTIDDLPWVRLDRIAPTDLQTCHVCSGDIACA